MSHTNYISHGGSGKSAREEDVKLNSAKLGSLININSRSLTGFRVRMVRAWSWVLWMEIFGNFAGSWIIWKIIEASRIWLESFSWDLLNFWSSLKRFKQQNVFKLTKLTLLGHFYLIKTSFATMRAIISVIICRRESFSSIKSFSEILGLVKSLSALTSIHNLKVS